MERIERIEQITAEIREKKIPLVFVYFVGPDGELNNKVFITGYEKEHMDISLLDGIAVNGQLLRGWEKRPEAEWLLLIPEIERIQYNIHTKTPYAYLLGSFLDFPLDSRACVKRAVKFARESGYIPFCGTSLIFGIKGEGITSGNNMMKLYPESTAAQINYEITKNLSENGIKIEYFQALSSIHSVFDIMPTEFEIQLDNYSLVKEYTHSICESQGLHIEYTSPEYTIPLSSVPIHLSLWNNEKSKNLFFDENDEMELSEIGKKFIAGILVHASELSLLIPQDDKLSIAEKWRIGYSIHRDNSIVHIPVYLKEKKKHDRVGWGKRIMFNGLSHRCNHYTSASAVLIAGIDGINNNLNLDEVVSKGFKDTQQIESDSIFHKIMGNEIVNYLVKQNEENLSI